MRKSQKNELPQMVQVLSLNKISSYKKSEKLGRGIRYGRLSGKAQ